MKRVTIVLASVLLAQACKESPTSTADAPVTNNPSPAVSVTVALSETVKAINPCTEEIVIYKVRGTAYVQSHIATYEVNGTGDISTNDGFKGTFAGQFVFAGASQHLLFADSRATNAEGRRITLRVGMHYERATNGQPLLVIEEVTPTGCEAGIA
jgi:hypothetical protein